MMNGTMRRMMSRMVYRVMMRTMVYRMMHRVMRNGTVILSHRKAGHGYKYYGG
jgi:hypothetical protein